MLQLKLALQEGEAAQAAQKTQCRVNSATEFS
jgi:hypothetical protein